MYRTAFYMPSDVSSDLTFLLDLLAFKISQNTSSTLFKFSHTYIHTYILPHNIMRKYGECKKTIENFFTNFDVLLTVHLSIFISVINQLDAHNFCFSVSLFHASTCFEYMCSSSGGQICITPTTYRCDDTRGCVMQF